MSNKKTHPRLCVVFFPPYDHKLGRRPHSVMIAREHVSSALEMKRACAIRKPPQELLRARGVGQFFVGFETDFDADCPVSEYKNLAPWCGSEKSGHYLDFIETLVAPFFVVGSRQAA